MRTVVGVEGPGVAGVDAVVIMGVNIVPFCSLVRGIFATSIVLPVSPTSTSTTTIDDDHAMKRSFARLRFGREFVGVSCSLALIA